MKFKYYKKDDILVLRFSKHSVDDSHEVENAILEVDKNKAPVSLEILHASRFFSDVSRELPKEIKTKFIASS